MPALLRCASSISGTLPEIVVCTCFWSCFVSRYKSSGACGLGFSLIFGSSMGMIHAESFETLIFFRGELLDFLGLLKNVVFEARNFHIPYPC